MSNWLQHTLREGPWRTRRQAVAFISLGIFVAIIIGALYLAQAASTSTTGRQLEQLIQQRNQLEQANEQLRAEIAALKSVPRLLARAQELGFVPASRENMEYLVVDGYNPARETVIELPQEDNNEPVLVYEETLIGWLQQQFDTFSNQLEGFSNQGGE